jgi:hypothetical protein
MLIPISLCFGDELYYRIEFKTPDGRVVRERIPNGDVNWGRKHSIHALNLLEHVYGLKRKNIRFG